MNFNQAQKQYINKLIKKARAEERAKIIKAMDEKWLSPPWSPEWNDEVYKVEGYRRAIKDLKELK